MASGEERKGWGTARVSGDSMRPTYRPGDLLLIRYRARPRVGRAAIVRLPGRGLAVKRVTRRVPEGWWVERDNPAVGVDSWLVGAIPDADVVAVVVLRLWRPLVGSQRPRGNEPGRSD